jgi:hypothetical protein
VEYRVRVKGDPFIEVTYENKQVERIHTADLNITQIIQQVQNKAEEMDTMQVGVLSFFGLVLLDFVINKWDRQSRP